MLIFWVAWVVLIYFYLAFLADCGVGKIKKAFAFSMAYIIATKQLKHELKQTINRDPSWIDAKIKLKSVDIEYAHRDSISFIYRGSFSKPKMLSLGRELPYTSYRTEWSFWLKLRSVLRTLSFHPEVMKLVGPILIATLPVIFVTTNFALLQTLIVYIKN